MEFRAKLVVSRRNKKAYIAYGGLIVAASSLILVFIPSLTDYIPYVFGIGIAIIIIGALIARGDVRQYGLSDLELVVNMEGISIGNVHYPYRLVSEINFNVEAYNGMYVNDGAMISGSNSDGMTNDVSFMSGGSKVSCGFYLASPAQVQQLIAIFDQFYRRRIAFIERNRGRQTYLLRFMNERELDAFKREYGYL